MDTIDISHHRPALGELARRYELPVSEVIDRIIECGINHEGEIFDWSPSPLKEVSCLSVETIVPSEERQSA